MTTCTTRGGEAVIPQGLLELLASQLQKPRQRSPWGLSIPAAGAGCEHGWGIPRRNTHCCRPALTFRTKVLSLSGISNGMVVRTSMMADSGMLTLGLEAWEKKNKEKN